jgi:hypothetical protein
MNKTVIERSPFCSSSVLFKVFVKPPNYSKEKWRFRLKTRSITRRHELFNWQDGRKYWGVDLMQWSIPKVTSTAHYELPTLVYRQQL